MVQSDRAAGLGVLQRSAEGRPRCRHSPERQGGGGAQVPIVIIAEDGVTSLRYYVAITRAEAAAAPGPAPQAEGAPQSAVGAGAAALEEGSLPPPAGPLASSLAAFANAAGLAPVQVHCSAAIVCVRRKGSVSISLTVRNGGGVRNPGAGLAVVAASGGEAS